MKNALAKAVTHRQFLKMCGLAIVGASASQLVVPPKPVEALYSINDHLYVSGNVGIGTSTPQAQLDVVGMGAMASDYWGLRLRSTDDSKRMEMGWYTTRNRMEISTWDSQYGWQSVPLVIMPSTVVFDGNVGIGTVSPSARLHLYNGAIKIGSRVIADDFGSYYA